MSPGPPSEYLRHLVPAELARDRGPVLVRTLRGLPDEALAALVRGLARGRAELVAGRLFRRGRRRACVVGVMLLELRPERFAVGRVRFLLRHGWRRHAFSYRHDPLARSPRLYHLEWTFDRALHALVDARPELARPEAAALIGRWFAAEAAGELDRRLIRHLVRTAERPIGSGSYRAPQPSSDRPGTARVL